MPAPKEAFISHSTRNKKFAQWLASELERHGISSFLSGNSLKGSEEWQQDIGEALERCDWFLLILSEQALASRWVRWEYAYARASTRFERRITPLYWRKCEPRGAFFTVRLIQHIRFVSNKVEGLKRLLRMWDVEHIPSAT